MKPKEGPGGSTTNMKLTRNISNTQKGNSGSLKFAFLIFYFASLCSLSSGAYPSRPTFAIKNRDCGKYILPNHYRNNPEGDRLLLWDRLRFSIYYRFEQVQGRWGYIRHIHSNKVWYPEGNSRSTGTKIVLRSSTSYHTLFSIDQTNGFIQHYHGLYVHYEDKSCDLLDRIHLWDSIHHRMRWDFVNPLDVWEKVLPYGTFKVSGHWQLGFALHNARTSHSYEYRFKKGQSQAKSRTTQFGFEWQVGAEADVWFGKASTSVTLSGQIQHTSSSEWYSETEVTHNIKVIKGESVAVWQKIITGEQLGNREVFQLDIFEHTESRYNPPRDNTRRTLYQNQDNVSILTVNERKRSDHKIKVLLGEYGQTDSVNSNSDERREFENNIEDESMLMLNVTEENIEYDENGVFSLYNYTITDNGDTAEDHDEDIDYNENGKFSLYDYTLTDYGDTLEDHGEDIDYDENGVFSIYNYTISDNGDTDEDHDELEINKVNQNSDGESNPPPVSITYQSRKEDVMFKPIHNENVDIKHDELTKPYKITNVRKRKMLHKERSTNDEKH